MSENTSVHYRPEIGPARLQSLLFHAGFSLFSAGYVGVDVFFVVSGYLITFFYLKKRQAHFLYQNFTNEADSARTISGNFRNRFGFYCIFRNFQRAS